ncbi:hypothetical protein LZG74_25465 [Dyadobacter sp. CY327]|uniref:hypothetical protein n=1 Tax=Dyadobacter sp. CY327 TaxID=2907301 RepID=UPI001F3B63D4|nr:hypothetical protein [Dyadobacter sp. CY327]MCE7073684.1 hypothetical protein [Dyadobacter sp. CY327]
MTNDHIDSIIDETLAAEQVADTEVKETDALNDEAADEGESKQPEGDKKPSSDDFPKKAVNALSRRDRQIGKLKAINENYATELASLREAVAKLEGKADAPKAPNQDDFENYGEYLEAKVLYQLEQKQAQQAQSKQQETQQSTDQQKYAQWEGQREQAIAEQTAKLKTEIPDLEAVVMENADLADDFPPVIQRLFLEATNAPLAFYNLAKEGKLEALAHMSPHMAAAEITRAQSIAPPIRKTTQAPAPLAPARGAAPGSKNLAQMSATDLVKWVNS